MEDPEPPPDPLSAFSITPDATPKSTAQLPASHGHRAPDPSPPPADLQTGGSHGTSELRLDASRSGRGSGPSSVGDSSTPPVHASELGAVMEDRRVAIDDEQSYSTLIKRAGATQEHSLPPEQAASPVNRPSSVQEFSIPSEQAAPSVRLPSNVQEPLLQSGFDTGDNCHQPMASPWSPTDIAPEFQAQAWAILPDLAMALHNIKTARHQAGTATARGSPAINSHPEATQRLEGAKAFINLHPEAEGRNLIESSQEDIAIQNAILQSRIPASQKGKGQQVEEGIHGNQSTHSYAPATPPTSPVKSPSFESKDMWYHKLDLEEGWEPAKASRRKRLATEVNQSRSSPQSRDPLSGSAFFKNKMEGKCFNCFSQNHHAYSCNRRQGAGNAPVLGIEQWPALPIPEGLGIKWSIITSRASTPASSSPASSSTVTR